MIHDADGSPGRDRGRSTRRACDGEIPESESHKGRVVFEWRDLARRSELDCATVREHERSAVTRTTARTAHDYDEPRGQNDSLHVPLMANGGSIHRTVLRVLERMFHAIDVEPSLRVEPIIRFQLLTYVVDQVGKGTTRRRDHRRERAALFSCACHERSRVLKRLGPRATRRSIALGLRIPLPQRQSITRGRKNDQFQPITRRPENIEAPLAGEGRHREGIAIVPEGNANHVSQ